MITFKSYIYISFSLYGINYFAYFSYIIGKYIPGLIRPVLPFLCYIIYYPIGRFRTIVAFLIGSKEILLCFTESITNDTLAKVAPVSDTLVLIIIFCCSLFIYSLKLG